MRTQNIYNSVDIVIPDGQDIHNDEVTAGGHKKVADASLLAATASVTSFSNGRNSDVGTAAEQVVVASTPATRYVTIKAASTNAGIVYVGGAGVTANTVDATDGYELVAGGSITIPVDDVNKVYVIASQITQGVYWVAV